MPIICIGKIKSAHGIKGQLKLISYTEDPLNLLDYAPITDKTGQKIFQFTLISQKKNLLTVSLEGISTRNEAEALEQIELFTDRDNLPELEEEEFYYEDLIGLTVHHQDDHNFAQVVQLFNHGGGDIIEIKEKISGKTHLLAFNKENVPEIHIAAGYIVVALPETEYVENES